MAVVAFGSRGEFVGRSNRVAFTGVLDMRRVVGMGRVFARVFLVMLIMSVIGTVILYPPQDDGSGAMPRYVEPSIVGLRAGSLSGFGSSWVVPSQRR